MALPVLDGNQTATTLSSVVTGGEHIVAHSVVSLGANAIANITSAVSGSVVSVSNLPSTQTIAGTVTVGNLLSQVYDSQKDTYLNQSSLWYYSPSAQENLQVQDVADGNGGPLPISGTVTANNSTLDSAVYFVTGADVNTIRTVIYSGGDLGGDQGAPVDGLNPLPITGCVNSTPLPISGTVTAAAPNGSLTTRFGTPTTANVSFATSAVTNANRKYLLIQNVTTGSNVITVGIGFTPTTTQGIQLTAGAGITFESSYIPTGAVQILSSVTASNFTILEA